MLLSVFIPTAFISGITGQLYKQFALTIAVSAAFRVSTPPHLYPGYVFAILQTHQWRSRASVYRWFNTGFEGEMPITAPWAACWADR